MGEATYYMKARFESEEKAGEALPKLKEFLGEVLQAENWWQEHRDMQHQGKTKTFFRNFEKQFPLAYGYLRDQCGLDFTDCNNRLAGLLSMIGESDDLEHAYQRDDLLVYSALVWHFADWDPLMGWIEAELGAKATGWVSDEYADLSDCIELD